MTRLGSAVASWSFASALVVACANLVGDVKVVTDELQGNDAGADATSAGPARATACESGLLRCQGPVFQRCLADGSGWMSLARCASAALCVARDGEVSGCRDPACEFGITCDDNVLRMCNVDSTGYDVLDTCLSNTHCDAMDGACQEAACTPGEVSCNGAVLEVCTPSGHDALVSCATSALCDDLVAQTCGEDLVGCDVSAAACPEPVCAPNELRCTGTRLEVCNSGRNGWDFVDECVTAGVCQLTLANPVAVSCVEPPCNPGDRICSPQGAILECNADRTAYSVQRDQCLSVDLCTPAGCTNAPCTPGDLSCNGSMLQECQGQANTSNLARVDRADCLTRELCLQTLSRGPGVAPNVCAPAVCAPGEFQCLGRQIQECNPGRTGFVDRALCATEELCQASAALGVCQPPCTGFACNGAMLRACNEGLTALEDRENCGSSAQCDSVSGRCTDPCTPGGLRCNGAVLEECRSLLEGWRRLGTCESAGLCQLSVSSGARSCQVRRCAPGTHQCTGQNLEACKADLTGFELVRSCAGGQICDAASRQCDVCSAGSVDCEGDTFERCSDNGQQLSTTPCGSGLCSDAGTNVGCLACGTPGGFRCDNQGSLFQCSADQQRETQQDVCRTPQLCRADRGQCLDCDPPGSSRCEGADVKLCSAQNTESTSQVCASESLCRPSGPGTVTCEDSPCTVPFQCTVAGEVLVCNAQRTGYVAQNPRVVCASPALCDVTDPDGCRAPACDAGERQCDGQSVEICNEARTDFRPAETCASAALCLAPGCPASGSCCGAPACAAGALGCDGNELNRCNADLTAIDAPIAVCQSEGLCQEAVRTGSSVCPACLPGATSCVSGAALGICVEGQVQAEACGAGFACVASGGAASCRCSPGSYRCVAQGLQQCNGTGTQFADVSGDSECDGAFRVSCSNSSVVRNDCGDSARCEASSGAACAACATNADCSDGLFCNGVETCGAGGQCLQGAAPCADDGVFCNGSESCNEAADACVSSGNPCPAGTACSGNACSAPADGGT